MKRRHTKYRPHCFTIRVNRHANALWNSCTKATPCSFLVFFFPTFISFFLLPAFLSSVSSFPLPLSLYLSLHWVRAFGSGRDMVLACGLAFIQLSLETGYTGNIAPIKKSIEDDESPHWWRKKFHVWKEEWLKTKLMCCIGIGGIIEYILYLICILIRRYIYIYILYIYHTHTVLPPK